MSFLGLCAKARPSFLSKGSLLLTCPAAHNKPVSAQLSSVLHCRMKILHIENPARMTTKRQIQFKPSERKTRVAPSRNWDQVSSNFQLVYENSIKNWIWGLYISQAAIVSGCCWLAINKLHVLLDIMSESDIQAALACCSVFILSGAYYNFIATRTCIRIYHSSESGKFVAVRRTFVGRLQKIYYAPSDVTICSQQSDEKDMKILIEVKGKKFRLLSSEFESPEYFNMHLYDARHRE